MAYLSFNKSVNHDLKFTTEDPDDDEGLLGQEMPLRYSWVVWEQLVTQDGKAASQYSDVTHQVSTFASVQEFWKIWTSLPQPSELLEHKHMFRKHADGDQLIDALMIFREGVRPEWEDKANASGGHFQFQLKSTVGGGQIDEYWNNLALGIIGATIQPASMITGIRLVDKLSGPRAANVIRLEVWFQSYDDIQAREALRKSVELCMATRLDGSLGQPPKYETKSHLQQPPKPASGTSPARSP